MGVSEGGGKIESTQRSMLVEQGNFPGISKFQHHGIRCLFSAK